MRSVTKACVSLVPSHLFVVASMLTVLVAISVSSVSVMMDVVVILIVPTARSVEVESAPLPVCDKKIVLAVYVGMVSVRKMRVGMMATVRKDGSAHSLVSVVGSDVASLPIVQLDRFVKNNAV